MNKLVKTIPRESLSREFLKSLNGLLDLTNREIELLSVFLDIQALADKQKGTREKLDSYNNRKFIMATTGIAKENLSRYVKAFKDKGIFISNALGEIVEVNSALVPILIGGKTVQITLILKMKDNDEISNKGR